MKTFFLLVLSFVLATELTYARGSIGGGRGFSGSSVGKTSPSRFNFWRSSPSPRTFRSNGITYNTRSSAMNWYPMWILMRNRQVGHIAPGQKMQTCFTCHSGNSCYDCHSKEGGF